MAYLQKNITIFKRIVHLRRGYIEIFGLWVTWADQAQLIQEQNQIEEHAINSKSTLFIYSSFQTQIRKKHIQKKKIL